MADLLLIPWLSVVIMGPSVGYSGGQLSIRFFILLREQVQEVVPQLRLELECLRLEAQLVVSIGIGHQPIQSESF